MELLEWLAQEKHCHYISDLRFLQKNSLCFPRLKWIELAAYPEKEWQEAAWYLFQCKYKNGEQARLRLIGDINLDSGRLLLQPTSKNNEYITDGER